MTKTRSLTIGKIVIYCIVFFAIWSVRELIIRPVFLDSLNDVISSVAETLMKISVWTVPAIILIKHFEKDMAISLREMLTKEVKWIKYLPILLGFLLYQLFGAWLTSGEIGIHPDFTSIRLISTVIFVGITEEIAFRAFLLNATLTKMKPWSAVLLNAALFVPIHYPFWIYQGLGLNEFLMGSVVVLAMSIIFSWTFIKSRNIFVPIILHMIWNLLTVLLFG